MDEATAAALAQASFAAFAAAICAGALAEARLINDVQRQQISAALDRGIWTGERADQWRADMRGIIYASNKAPDAPQ